VKAQPVCMKCGLAHRRQGSFCTHCGARRLPRWREILPTAAAFALALIGAAFGIWGMGVMSRPPRVETVEKKIEVVKEVPKIVNIPIVPPASLAELKAAHSEIARLKADNQKANDANTALASANEGLTRQIQSASLVADTSASVELAGEKARTKSLREQNAVLESQISAKDKEISELNSSIRALRGELGRRAAGGADGILGARHLKRENWTSITTSMAARVPVVPADLTRILGAPTGIQDYRTYTIWKYEDGSVTIRDGFVVSVTPPSALR
jgi:hypothetical protein